MIKQTFFIVLALSLSTKLSAQNDFNKLSVGASIGSHDGMAPTTSATKSYQLHHYGVNARYMLNNRFGVMADLGYDLFDFEGSAGNNTNYVRTSIQAVVNAADILRFDSWCPKAGLLIHGGAGISNMWQKDLYTDSVNRPLFDNSDDMTNFIFGITPQYKINDRFSVNADLSFIFHGRQSYKFDFSERNLRHGIGGYFLNTSIGVTYAIGKNKSHADWTPTVYGGSNNSSLETRVKELEERAKDDDQDGVPNYVDAEANTPKGSYVNSKGEAMKANDRDADGIADEFDMCPDVKGTFGLNGCIDTDKDGIADNEDACPTVMGTRGNKGCPEISKETKEVLNRALKGVQFETAKDVILTSSYPVLNEVVSVLIKNPEYKLSIEGHTDNVGEDQANLSLSEKRATAVLNYLSSKGISKERMTSKGFGETQPKALNDTEEGKAINRRVEFNIVF